LTELLKIGVQRLQRATVAHPDPDVIAAFIEKSLGESEREQVLVHLAACADCRDVVAFALPEGEASLPSVASARAQWTSWPVLRWGAIAACVAIVGAAVSLHRQFPSSSPPQSPVESSQSSSLTPALQAPVETKAQPAADAASASKKAVASVQKTTNSTAGKARTTPAFAAVLKPQAAPPPAKTEAPMVADTVASSSPAADEAIPGRAKDAPQPPEAVGGRMVAKSSVAMAQTSVESGAASPRWTLGADGVLHRSMDLGRTWETVPVPSQANIRALAAYGLDIWVGGSRGALYHSPDAGANWTQIQPAADGQVLSDDIIGVEFVDSLHGTVTTSGREKWLTADAGQTWQKQ
jgi:hypothetical protein